MRPLGPLGSLTTSPRAAAAVQGRALGALAQPLGATYEGLAPPPPPFAGRGPAMALAGVGQAMLRGRLSDGRHADAASTC